MTEDEKFERSIAFSLKWEGGRNFSIVNGKPVIKGAAKNDLGGATAFGITWNTLKRAHSLGILPHDDICSLTLDEAKLIYRANFWDKFHWGELDFPVCLCTLDCSINHGRFAVILQRAVNSSGGNLIVDGKFGPKTRAGLKSIAPGILAKAIYSERKNYFLAIVRNNPSQRVFLKGWLNRCEAMKFAAGV